ncbi:Cysteine-rich RLK (receptor-like protein kinase) 8 [Cucumis melo var. makuwa]|uniref:Cysteine-rich RLK (Receptor-like protein kinase) 8 n=1 Tax=Cucumis melo var. makuwa TaxID=1194695 RepID=A0A5A7U223_CUCMM|nr:Cysteine-rich RLK (receptor-like protein kinase) 8 [Cucumis melo var. makuwa]TYK07973.1 Cysteine-rich RLK (receptor-like protein kinase) 8 [Cucumis melo var. makuwa]
MVVSFKTTLLTSSYPLNESFTKVPVLTAPNKMRLPNEKNRHLLEVARFLMLSTSLPSYLWGDALFTSAHLINRMPSRVLHFQTQLDCLKESYPFGCSDAQPMSIVTVLTKLNSILGLRLVCLLGILCTNEAINASTYLHESTLLLWMSLLLKIVLSFPIAYFGGECENDGPETAVLEDMGDNHSGITSKYDPSLDLPIALKKDTSLDSNTIPKSIHLALECPKWKVAIMEEMKAPEKNKTWELCTLSKGHKTVGSKWVFTLKFSTSTKSQRYNQGHSDHTLFTKVSKVGKIAILIVYVNDIVLFGDDTYEIVKLKKKMGFEFETKDLGNLKCLFKMEIARSKEGISVSQRKYTLDLLDETGFVLIKKNNTRLDISYIVSTVNQFMHAPYEDHMEAVNRILRYLKATLGKGLRFRKTDRRCVEAYTDSDWAKSLLIESLPHDTILLCGVIL